VLVLAIESATDAAGVALADDQGTLAQSTLGRGRRHAETIAPSIRSCCAAAGVNLRQIDAVVVDSGPGLFTGLRVGVGTAKALAYALGTPLVAVSSLDVLAQAAGGWAAGAVRVTSEDDSGHIEIPYKSTREFTSSQFENLESIDRIIVAVLDARRGEVVSAEFALAGATATATGAPCRLARIGEECLEAPSALASRLSGRRTTLVGDGALRYAEMFSKVPGVMIGARWLASPPVAVVAEMGVELARLGMFDDALTLSPRYVRHADARINWVSRAPRTGTEA
jgi:tRNA threonylcarbamoyladenosine biosynthesis protein TsaB